MCTQSGLKLWILLDYTMYIQNTFWKLILAYVVCFKVKPYYFSFASLTQLNILECRPAPPTYHSVMKKPPEKTTSNAFFHSCTFVWTVTDYKQTVIHTWANYSEMWFKSRGTVIFIICMYNFMVSLSCNFSLFW